MSVARINGDGQVETACSIAFLTIDDSYGRMPDKCPNEVIPHILAALGDLPDRPGPLVWVYPFQEYHEMTFSKPARLQEPFFGDWFMRAAVNNGLPLCTVVSTMNLVTSICQFPGMYGESVLVTPAPDANSGVGSAVALDLCEYVQRGGQVLLYGPLDHTERDLLEMLNLRLAEPIAGQLQVDLRASPDRLSEGAYPRQLQHREAMCAGGCREVLRDPADPHTQVVALVSQGKQERVAAVVRRLPKWKGGALAWVRGTNSNSYRGGHLLTPDDPQQWFQGDLLMRFTLDALGYRVRFSKRVAEQRNPVLSIARHENGFFLSGYTPDTTVELRLRFPHGAPLLTGMETELTDGQAAYRLPRAWHRECRVLVDQPAGEISCVEQTGEEIGLRRRLRISGLKDAVVCFYPETRPGAPVNMQVDPKLPFIAGPFLDYQVHNDHQGHYLTAEHVSGTLLISW